jgi:hypothetical protein
VTTFLFTFGFMSMFQDLVCGGQCSCSCSCSAACCCSCPELADRSGWFFCLQDRNRMLVRIVIRLCLTLRLEEIRFMVSAASSSADRNRMYNQGLARRDSILRLRTYSFGALYADSLCAALGHSVGIMSGY